MRHGQPCTIDQIEKEWLALCQRLAKQGVPRQPHEGPQDYAARLEATKPELCEAFKPIVQSYIRLRYGPGSVDISPADIKTFRLAVKNCSI